ncbi:hypothetical protein DERP_015150 [Dermatophagoides pteronyssinus]|uniref:Uncharacterized protein n=1 Tax=Dermatophagoides pteronyssinus TaxID=6956 RepID=A0ABQ8JTK6_DERPT|nr:hypothetical protein DERP_015150 [Dermatophagoides pteronyssinus]
MTLATQQQQQQNCCLKQLQQQQQQHQLTTANMMNVEQKSKKIAGFRKWKHQQPVGNQQPPIDNDGKTFTAAAAVEADNNTIISSSSSSTGSLMKRTDPIFARNSHTSMDTFICVEEPFNHTNTSHSVHNDFMFNFILKSFRWTKDLLQKMKMNSDDFV